MIARLKRFLRVMRARREDDQTHTYVCYGGPMDGQRWSRRHKSTTCVRDGPPSVLLCAWELVECGHVPIGWYMLNDATRRHEWRALPTLTPPHNTGCQ
jgi:hypothetical protein